MITMTEAQVHQSKLLQRILSAGFLFNLIDLYYKNDFFHIISFVFEKQRLNNYTTILYHSKCVFKNNSHFCILMSLFRRVCM
ncbi:hypothetical protein BCV72DRAFT_12248 [Rhizopus microsporus var. microsporus]|uniref:Uncharacterized protein n=1 Tax=Rhizopus microsporus var. microsporus TaxID=86635 RepID=A0A1X0QXV8_RHIZD|nr:hypothetical protein BCV72DRAFT_12248 [Rhizopus microsporus var. microsporus]